MTSWQADILSFCHRLLLFEQSQIHAPSPIASSIEWLFLGCLYMSTLMVPSLDGRGAPTLAGGMMKNLLAYGTQSTHLYHRPSTSKRFLVLSNQMVCHTYCFTEATLANSETRTRVHAETRLRSRDTVITSCRTTRAAEISMYIDKYIFHFLPLPQSTRQTDLLQHLDICLTGTPSYRLLRRRDQQILSSLTPTSLRFPAALSMTYNPS